MAHMTKTHTQIGATFSTISTTQNRLQPFVTPSNHHKFHVGYKPTRTSYLCHNEDKYKRSMQSVEMHGHKDKLTILVTGDSHALKPSFPMRARYTTFSVWDILLRNSLQPTSKRHTYGSASAFATVICLRQCRISVHLCASVFVRRLKLAFCDYLLYAIGLFNYHN